MQRRYGRSYVNKIMGKRHGIKLSSYLRLSSSISTSLRPLNSSSGLSCPASHSSCLSASCTTCLTGSKSETSFGIPRPRVFKLGTSKIKADGSKRSDSRIFLFGIAFICFLTERLMISPFPAGDFLILLILKRYRGQLGGGSCVPSAVAEGWVRTAGFTIGRWHGNRLTTAASPFIYCEPYDPRESCIINFAAAQLKLRGTHVFSI